MRQKLFFYFFLTSLSPHVWASEDGDISPEENSFHTSPQKKVKNLINNLPLDPNQKHLPDAKPAGRIKIKACKKLPGEDEEESNRSNKLYTEEEVNLIAAEIDAYISKNLKNPNLGLCASEIARQIYNQSRLADIFFNRSSDALVQKIKKEVEEDKRFKRIKGKKGDNSKTIYNIALRTEKKKPMSDHRPERSSSPKENKKVKPEKITLKKLLQDAQENNNGLSGQLGLVQAETQQLKDAYQKAQNVIGDLDKRLQETQNSKDNLKSELDKTQNQLNNTQKTNEELNEKHRKLEETIENLKKLLAEAQTSKNDLSGRFGVVQAENQQLQNSHKTLQGKLTETQKENEWRGKKINELEKQIENLSKKNNDQITELKKEAEELRVENAKLLGEKESRDKSIKFLQEMVGNSASRPQHLPQNPGNSLNTLYGLGVSMNGLMNPQPSLMSLFPQQIVNYRQLQQQLQQQIQRQPQSQEPQPIKVEEQPQQATNSETTVQEENTTGGRGKRRGRRPGGRGGRGRGGALTITREASSREESRSPSEYSPPVKQKGKPGRKPKTQPNAQSED